MTNASLDGFYTAYVTGKAGQGLAMLVFRKGAIIGSDSSGVLFDGTYSEKGSDLVSVSLNVKTPPNVNLIQGGSSGSNGMDTKLDFDIPLSFASQPFIRIEGPNGPVNAKLTKLRGLDD